jgi:hypothetical protein
MDHQSGRLRDIFLLWRTADRNAQNATRAYESGISTVGNLSLDEYLEIAVKRTRLSEILPKVLGR